MHACCLTEILLHATHPKILTGIGNTATMPASPSSYTQMNAAQKPAGRELANRVKIGHLLIHRLKDHSIREQIWAWEARPLLPCT